ncbi:MAG TPA: SRPBCC domain-containing protein [Streptosporangiaceae bacterium]|nr:SRPBCC domain-containing protein [Streptosporangiaceae bacterium]
MSTVPPVRREILVDANQATAFEVFTHDIGRWWPVADNSVYGAGGTVTLADQEIVERSADGHSALWGTITRWEPPAAVSFTWHPGQTPDRASRVEVTFAAAPGGAAAEPAGQTLVTLVHTGWDSFDDPAAARADYDQGWPPVLGRYADHLGTLLPPPDAPSAPDAPGSAGGEAGETWVALLHQPGPAAPTEGSLFDAPGFGEHFAFLTRMRDAGYLVAAGPLADEDGAGLTILRLPGANRLDEARRLAAEDDLSVAGGFFTVAVRPWHVVLGPNDTEGRPQG